VTEPEAELREQIAALEEDLGEVLSGRSNPHNTLQAVMHRRLGQEIEELKNSVDTAAYEWVIYQVGHRLRELVPEEVETNAQLQTLWGLGCDRIQGFLNSRPLFRTPVEELCRASPFPGDALGGCR
jgi:hypothetical protein